MRVARIRNPGLALFSLVALTCSVMEPIARAWPVGQAAPTAPTARLPSAMVAVTPFAPLGSPSTSNPKANAAPGKAPTLPGTPETQTQTQTPGPPAKPQAGDARAPSAALPAPQSATPPATAPVDAAGALERARAAYEYGDIDEMVETARAVADGRLRPSPSQRASALRYLGIGLFLTGRAEGAETAFFELLRLRPESHLDPHTTRPDAVAFFEQVRARYAEPIRDAARASNRKTFAWNFLPPMGQLQNRHTSRAIVIGGIELVSLGTAIGTFALLKSWRGPHDTFPGRQDEAAFLRQVNWISIGVLGATFLYGVIDGIAHYGDPTDENAPGTTESTPRASLTPGGLQLRF